MSKVLHLPLPRKTNVFVRIGYVLLLILLPCSSLYSQWVQVAGNVLGGGFFGAVCYKDNHLWAGRTDLFHSVASGGIWTKVLTLASGDAIVSIDFLDSVNGVVKTIYKTYVTNNMGQTWRTYTQMGYAACFLGSADRIACIGNPTDIIMVTTNGGTSWNTTFSESQSPLLAYYLIYQGKGKVVANGGLHFLYSTDYGQTWTVKKDTAVLYDSWSFTVDPCGERNEVYVASEDVSNVKNFASILKSTDDGMSWTVSLKRAPSTICGSIVRNSQTIFAQTVDSGIIASTDDGITWNSIGGPSGLLDTRRIATIGNSTVIAGDKFGNLWRNDNLNAGNASGGIGTTPLEFILSMKNCTSDSVRIILSGKLCHSYLITAIESSGPDAAFYTISHGTLPIAMGKTTDTVKVQINKPGFSGTSNNFIRITLYDEYDNLSHDTLISVSSLLKVKPPHVTTSLASVVFDTTGPCDYTKDTLITIRNTGCDTIRLVSGPGTLTPGITIDPLVFPVVLPVDSSVDIIVHFRPLKTGYVSAIAQFAAKQYDVVQELNIPISGIGSRAALGLVVGDSIVSFATISNCVPESDTEIFLHNIGCDPITIPSDPSGLTKDFSIDPLSFPIVILPGDSIRVRVHFHSKTVGSTGCLIIFTGSRPWSEDTIRIQLQGINIGSLPGLTVADSILDFKTISLCDPTSDTTIRFVNRGCDTIKITSGTGIINAAFSTDAVPLPIVIPPGESADIGFQFHPKGAGTYMAKASFLATQRGKVQTLNIDLVGRAVASASTPIVTTTIFDFKTVSVCALTGEDTIVTFKNRGCDTLILVSGPGIPSGAFSADPIVFPLSLPPDSSLEVTFHFRPTVAGSVTVYPHFDIQRQGFTGSIDLTLNGLASAGESIFSSSPSLSFDPISICLQDSAEIVYTNIGCDSLFVTGIGLSGDKDFTASGSTEQAIAAGDTVHIKVVLSPLQKGNRSGFYTLRVRSRSGQVIDTLIPITAVITDGAPLLTCSMKVIDFGVHTLCTSADTIVTVKNNGCDTLVISNAIMLGSGFNLNGSFPIIIAPGSSTTLTISTVLDTIGHKPDSKAILRIASNSAAPLSDITVAQGYDYPKKYQIYCIVDSLFAARGSIVPVRLVADSLPSGLTTITADLYVGNTDLLSYVNCSSSNSVSIAANTITITGNPIVAPNGILAELHYLVSLTSVDSTDIVFFNAHYNSTDIDYERCIASVSAGGTGTFSYRFGCGEALLSQVLRGDPIVKLISIHPNPASSDVTLEVQSREESEVMVRISNIIGKQQDAFTASLSPGINSLVRDIRSLPNGTYVIELHSAKGLVTSLFIKQQ